jgi:beta-fructofuranosidase
MRDQHHEAMIAKAEQGIATLQQQVSACPHRLSYHFMPPAAWMNDPNGLIRYKGEYHMFYQIHPFSAKNGLKHWGHAKSKDLVSWQHLPVALAPSEDFERNGCFSGTAVEHNGRLTLFYTGNVIDQGKRQVQCIAESEDGISFTKFHGNPVIKDFPKEGSSDFRDPKVWKHEDTWYMAIGSGKDGKANALLYRSADLFSWDYVGVMAESEGDLGGVWNCPEFFSIGDKDVLIVSPAVSPTKRDIRKAVYMIGKMDYETGKFMKERDGDIDFGPDFYAPQVLSDDQGRVVMFGWMDMWWNIMPTQDYGWAGAMTIPRVITLLPDGNLGFAPVPQLQELRASHERFADISLTPGCSGVLGDVQGDALEIVAVFQWHPDEDVRLAIKLRCSADGREETVIVYDTGACELSVDRSKSGLGEDTTPRCRLEPMPGSRVKLHIFMDRSSVEVFGNEGCVVLTSRVYPDPLSLGVDLSIEGGAADVVSVDIWHLKSIW